MYATQQSAPSVPSPTPLVKTDLAAEAMQRCVIHLGQSRLVECLPHRAGKSDGLGRRAGHAVELIAPLDELKRRRVAGHRLGDEDQHRVGRERSDRCLTEPERVIGEQRGERVRCPPILDGLDRAGHGRFKLASKVLI